MKWFLFGYCALTFSLLGCQYLPPSHIENRELPAKPVANKLEQTVEFGVNFAYEYSKTPKDTCIKYKKLYQDGDWRAGWVLALHVNETGNQSCLDSKQAVLILTALESEKKINPELIWLSQYHLRLLKKLQQTTEKVKKLQHVVRRNEQKATDLKKENKEQLEKLEALKAIETSINND